MPKIELTGEKRKLIKAAVLDALQRTPRGAIELDPVKLKIPAEAIASVLQEITTENPALCVTKWPGGGLALSRREQTESSLSKEGMQTMRSAGLIFNSGEHINPEKPKLSPDPMITEEQQRAAARHYHRDVKPRIDKARRAQKRSSRR